MVTGAGSRSGHREFVLPGRPGRHGATTKQRTELSAPLLSAPLPAPRFRHMVARTVRGLNC